MHRRHRLAHLAIAAAIPVLANSAIAGVSNWAGSMSIYNNNSGSQGSFIFSSPWSVSDLKTTVLTSNPTIIGDRLTLQPNFNAYSDEELRDLALGALAEQTRISAGTTVEP